ncbi:DUF190 domain-containing protein [Rubrobacter aplysinae]|uniref:DUF190 domain-containing protein n=1 Tax=Rubrobacter aplysinae TaxID=909625 RepID=UPI0009FECBBA|nr:DUF190 domain-containing protein [Rubrobacter aplysinae]
MEQKRPVVEQPHAEKVAGATVLTGIVGPRRWEHTSRILGFPDALPAIVAAIDHPEK